MSGRELPAQDPGAITREAVTGLQGTTTTAASGGVDRRGEQPALGAGVHRREALLLGSGEAFERGEAVDHRHGVRTVEHHLGRGTLMAGRSDSHGSGSARHRPRAGSSGSSSGGDLVGTPPPHVIDILPARTRPPGPGAPAPGRSCVRGAGEPARGGGSRSATPDAGVRILIGLVTAALVLLLGRAFQLQALDSQSYAAAAARQMTRTQELQPVRGEILDRNGKVLAMSEPAVKVIADPSIIATNGIDPRLTLTPSEQAAADAAPQAIATILAKYLGGAARRLPQVPHRQAGRTRPRGACTRS